MATEVYLSNCISYCWLAWLLFSSLVRYANTKERVGKVNTLITAVNKKNIEAVKVLLQKGADVNLEDGFNTTS